MRWYYKVLIVLGAVLVVVLFIIFGLKIKKVKVEGTEIYSKEEIVQSVFSRRFSDNELMFAIYRRLYGIAKLPFVEDIDVSYEGLHTVNLHVYDKTISGCIKYMGQYVYFDKDGIVLQSLQEKKEGVPVVTGIRFGDFTVGKPFNVKDDSLFATIMNLSQLIEHYHIEIKKISVRDGDIVLYTGNVKVFLGKKTMYDDEISALSSILETVKKEGLRGTIDMKSYKKGDNVSLQPDKK